MKLYDFYRREHTAEVVYFDRKNFTLTAWKWLKKTADSIENLPPSASCQVVLSVSVWHTDLKIPDIISLGVVGDVASILADLEAKAAAENFPLGRNVQTLEELEAMYSWFAAGNYRCGSRPLGIGRVKRQKALLGQSIIEKAFESGELGIFE